MEGYGYPYVPPQYPPVEYPDRGDGFGDYYSPHKDESAKEVRSPTWFNPGHYTHCGEPWEWPMYYWQWPSCSQYPSSTKRRHREPTRDSDTRSLSKSRSRSRSRSRSHSRSRTRSRSRSRSRSRTRSLSGTRTPSLSSNKLYRQPTLMDAFRVVYLTSSTKHKKSTTKYLATKKKQDRIHEILKSDGLGSKRWFFYPRKTISEPVNEVPGSRDNCDQRVKVDGHFLRKYKKSKKVESNAPAAKLKRWELILYEKLGFIQAV